VCDRIIEHLGRTMPDVCDAYVDLVVAIDQAAEQRA
jgi:hypothetical protein